MTRWAAGSRTPSRSEEAAGGAGTPSFGVRLDSGDLEYLSKKVRARLDEAGLTEARIMASNELDEHIVHQLITRGAPIDTWGVGTHLVTGGGDPALTGVYKICARGSGGTWVPDDQGVEQSREGDQPRHQAGLAVHECGRQPAGGPASAWRTMPPTPGTAQRFHHPMGDYTVIHARGLRGHARRFCRCE